MAVTLAEQLLSVGQTQLEASKDKAAAIESEGQAAADVIRLKNTAEVAGITTRVAAFKGDGNALAQNMIMAKFAPSFRTIMTNTEGPIMDLLKQAFTPAEKRPEMPSKPLKAVSPVTIPDQPFTSSPAVGTSSKPLKESGVK